MASTQVEYVILKALTRRGSYNDGILNIVGADEPDTVAQLIAMMTDVTVDEWTSEGWGAAGTGSDYWSYRGTLPCGLRLDVTTRAEDMERVEVP